MIGTLKKTKEGWAVKYATESEEDILPVIFIDQKYLFLDDSCIGREVHFEKVKIEDPAKNIKETYAKILGIAVEKEKDTWDSIAKNYCKPDIQLTYSVFEYLEKYYNVPTKK